MPPTVEDAGTIDETPVEEKPRPERRYRFDRRTPAVSTRIHTAAYRREQSNNSSFKALNAHVTSFQVRKRSRLHTSLCEPRPIRADFIETKSYTGGGSNKNRHVEKAKPARTTHDVRRRHGQERQREKVQATPSVSIPVPQEATTPVTEISNRKVQKLRLKIYHLWNTQNYRLQVQGGEENDVLVVRVKLQMLPLIP